jgi:hypothetical protein
MNEPKIVYTPLSEIVKWRKNPKLHAELDLKNSVQRFGFVQPLIVDERTGMLVSGHGRTETLVEMKRRGESAPEHVQVRDEDKEWLVPVVRGIAFKSDAEAEAYALATNRLVEIGGWQDESLLGLLKELQAQDALSGVGYDDHSIMEMQKQLDNPDALDEPPPEEQPQPGGFEQGAVRQIILIFGKEEFPGVTDALKKVRSEQEFDNNTDAVTWLLNSYPKFEPV